MTGPPDCEPGSGPDPGLGSHAIPGPTSLFDLSGRVAVVTGAAGGIGAGIARRLAEASADVVVTYRKNAAGAERVRTNVSDLRRQCLVLPTDVSQKAEVDWLMQRTVAELGRIDVLVNNAGVQPVAGLLDMDPEQFDAVIAANLRGVYLCTRAAAKRMIEQGDGGAIVNVASIEGDHPAPMHSHYGASKAGVLNHTMAAAVELGRYGIRVNAVSPGLIWREGIEEQWPDGVKRYLNAVPLGRLGYPDDVADACLFLASPASRWVTGIDLRVDGGVMARPTW